LKDRKTKFTSLNGAAFGKLILQWSELGELPVIRPNIQLQADTLLQMFSNESDQN
jgi:hypothetical protein